EFARFLIAPLRFSKQVTHRGRTRRKFIVNELEHGRESRAKLLTYLCAEHARCCFQRGSRVSLLGLVTVNRVKNARVLQISRDAHFSDRHEPEPRVAKPLVKPARNDLVNALSNFSCTWITHVHQFSRAGRA